MRKRMYVYMYVYWVTLLYSRKLTEQCKPAITEKIKIKKKKRAAVSDKQKTECNTGNIPLLFYFLFSFLLFLGLQPWHMEVPRLGVKSEL